MEKYIFDKEEIKHFVCANCSRIKETDEYVDLYECEGCGTFVSEAALEELKKYNVCEDENIHFVESEMLKN